MVQTAATLGQFVAYLMQQHKHNNSSLAQAAGVSESAIRNLLKVGQDRRAKDPDARTLRRVADALGVDPLKLFRLAGYIPTADEQITVRAEYLGRLFDLMPPEKQQAVLSLFEALADKPQAKQVIQSLHDSGGSDALAGVDLALPGLLRQEANRLIALYAMTDLPDIERIEPVAPILNTRWDNLKTETQERIKALIRAKLALHYDSSMVDEAFRR